MSAHTANPGKRYPPSGSFDASDLVVGPDGTRRLDAEANIWREIGEEIGLTPAELTPAGDWLMFAAGPGTQALVRMLHSGETAASLLPRLNRHIAGDPHQELVEVSALALTERLDPATTSGYLNELLAYLDTSGYNAPSRS